MHEEKPPAVAVAEACSPGSAPIAQRERVAAGDPLQGGVGRMRDGARIDGSATLTTVPSSRSMHSAASTTPRIHQRRGSPVVRDVSVCEHCSLTYITTMAARIWRVSSLPEPPSPPQRRARQARRRALDRETIVEAAIRILDTRRARRRDAATSRRRARRQRRVALRLRRVQGRSRRTDARPGHRARSTSQAFPTAARGRSRSKI